LDLLSSIYFPIFVETYEDLKAAQKADLEVSGWTEFMTTFVLKILDAILSNVATKHTVKLILSVKDVLTAQMMALINAEDSTDRLSDLARFATLREFVESLFIVMLSDQKIHKSVMDEWDEYQKFYKKFQMQDIKNMLGN